MNPNKPLLKLLIVTQIFSLLFMLCLPTLLRLLPSLLGKGLYALFVIISVGLVLALRYAWLSLSRG